MDLCPHVMFRISLDGQTKRHGGINFIMNRLAASRCHVNTVIIDCRKKGLHYLLPCLKRLLEIASDGFPVLFNLILDIYKAHGAVTGTIMKIIKVIKGCSGNFREVVFASTRMTTAAISFFAKQHCQFMEQYIGECGLCCGCTGHPKMLFVKCVVFDPEAQKLMPGQLNAEDFPHDVCLKLHETPTLGSPQSVTNFIEYFNDLQMQSGFDLETLEFSCTEVSLEGLNLVLSQFSETAEFCNCTLYEYIPVSNRKREIGLINLAPGKCTLTNMDITCTKTLSYLISLVEQLSDLEQPLQDLTFENCRLHLESIPNLLQPMVDMSDLIANLDNDSNDDDSDDDDSDDSNNNPKRGLVIMSAAFKSSQIIGPDKNINLIGSVTWSHDQNFVVADLPEIEIPNRIDFVETVIEFITTCPPFVGVRRLIMDGNLLGDGPIDVLVQNLYKTNLKCLDLSHVHMSDHGLEKIGNALKTNKTLEILDVYGNCRVTSKGVATIMSALLLNENTTLKCFKYDTELVDEKTFDTIEYLLALNRAGRGQPIIKNAELPNAGLLSFILKKVNSEPSMIYWMLQRFPHYLLTGYQ